MNILIVNDTIIPAKLYGGTERVIWDLGRELATMGHTVSYLVRRGSACDFAKVIPLDESREVTDQIPGYIDIVHFNFTPRDIAHFSRPYVITIHGNSNDFREFDRNSIFVSQNHANRYDADSFVYNGLDWNNYLRPDFRSERTYFHFLGKAAWRVKNVRGAIAIVNAIKGEKLRVMGGTRFNFKMGLRLTFSPKIKFHGMVGGKEKDRLLQLSKGLIFPVLWHEPFGLAIIESLYFGSPVFGTPYGSLPELISSDFGHLSASESELAEAVKNAESYSRQKCHAYAVENFNSRKMAAAYLEKYERVLNGFQLNRKPPRLVQLQKDKFLTWQKTGSG